MSVRARFYVAEITHQGYGGQQHESGKVVLVATSRKEGENREFWEATPSGRVELSLSAKGREALDWFSARLGQDVYLDFKDTSETVAGEAYRSQYEKSTIREQDELTAKIEAGA